MPSFNRSKKSSGLCVPVVLVLAVIACGPAAAQDPLEIGVTRSVTIQCGAMVELILVANEGDVLRIDVVETQDLGGGGSCPACCCFDQRVRLYSPGGALVAEQTSGIQSNCCSCRGRNILITPPLVESGEYTLTLSDQNTSGRGVVAVTAQVITSPVGEYSLTPGASILLSASPPGRFETLHVDVGEGTAVDISMEVTSGSVEPRLALYDRSNGHTLALPGNGEITGLVAPPGGLTLCSYSTVDQGGVYRITLEPAEFCADMDGDGVVGFADLVALLGAWGPCE